MFQTRESLPCDEPRLHRLLPVAAAATSATAVPHATSRVGHQRHEHTPSDRIRLLGRVGQRTLQDGVPVQLRGSKATHIRLGHEEHQQPQRSHPEEVLPGGSRLFVEVRSAQRRRSSPSTSNLWQSKEKTARSLSLSLHRQIHSKFLTFNTKIFF